MTSALVRPALAPAGKPRVRRWLGAALLTLSTLFWLLAALRVTNPLILADEYVYLIRGMTLDGPDRLAAIAPTVPNVGNYLFLRLINLFSRAHLPVDVATKVFNVVCFAASTHLIGALVLKRGEFPRAAVVFALAAFLPLGSYVAYVMPESAYLLVFVALFSLLARSPAARPYRLWAAAAALAGVLALIKAHGLFVLAAFLFATLAWSAFTGRMTLAKAVRLCLVAAGVFAAVVGAGVALLGPHGGAPDADLLGTTYRQVVKGSGIDADRIAVTLRFAAMQLSAVLLLLAPCLAFLLAGILADRRRADRAPDAPDLSSFLAIFLLALIALVVLVVSFLLYAEAERIQLRYVNFAFPCVLALAWIWSRAKPALDTPGFRMCAAAVWLLAAALFLYRLPGLRPLAADSPELFFSYHSGEFGAFGLGPTVRWVIGGLVLVCALALLHPKVRWFDAQLVALLVLVPLADVNTVRWQGVWSGSRTPLRMLGEVARAACGPGEADIVALGPYLDSGQLYTAMTGVGRPVPLRIGPESGVTTTQAIGGCVITPFDLKEALGEPLIQSQELSLYRPRVKWALDGGARFDTGERPAMLGAGWSGSEPTGIWTDGRRATLHLVPSVAQGRAPVIVEIDAVAYRPAPLAGQRVMVSADGRYLKTWTVEDGAYFVRLPPVETPGKPVELVLTLPDAVAPASAVPGTADRRLLGVAVRGVRVLRQVPALTPGEGQVAAPPAGR
jgi:hypothetical protein